MIKNSNPIPGDKQLKTYARQWGATSIPFNEANGFFEYEQTQQATLMLDQSASLKSLMLLAGPNGVGKSALVCIFQ